MLTKGIHHIALKARGRAEFDRTMNFYCDLLGCRLVRSWGEGENIAAMVDCGGSMLEIFANGNEVPGEGALRHMAFAVDDVDACVEKVRAAGYEITVEPNDIVIPSEIPFPVRIAFCNGPLGESLEFFFEK